MEQAAGRLVAALGPHARCDDPRAGFTGGVSADLPEVDPPRAVTDNSIFLQTAGDRIATRSGHLVSLRGVSLGGWMNMENFITGFPATESLQRAALRRALGEDVYRRFFDRLLDVFFADAD